MIKKHIIKEEGKPVAVILDYNEYLELKSLAEDRKDYNTAIETKRKNKKLIPHAELKKNSGCDVVLTFCDRNSGIENRNQDLVSGKDYSPSTMYNYYSINETLLHLAKVKWY